MTGIGDAHGSVGAQLRSYTGGEVSSGASDKALIEHGEHGDGIEALLRAGADSANEHRDEHRSAHAFAGDVAEYHQQAAVGFGQSLKEVAADSLRRTVLRFDREGRRVHDLGHEDALLQLLRLFHVQRDDLAGTLLAHPSAQEAAHDQCTDDQHHEDPRNIPDTDAEAEGRKTSGDTEGGEKEDIEAGELDQQ